MAKNDGLLIDSILENVNYGGDIGTKFEYFAIKEILKNFDLSEEELIDGIVDSGDDGGLDGIYYFVNDKYVTDFNNIDPKSALKFDLYILTCKHGEKYEMRLINDVASTLIELLDYSKDESDIKSEYNRELLSKMKFIKSIYYRIAPFIREFNVNVIYASRGCENQISENIKKKADFLENSVAKLFSGCNVKFSFVGAKELIAMYRKQNEMLSQIKLTEVLTSNDAYIALCSLKEYFNFVTDDSNELKRYYLDSNVRSYMGLNRVNSSIYDTLNDMNSPEFWFLNNGITILSDKVTLTGKTANILNAQIVNGLQTTETIFNYYKLKGEFEDDRNIMLKIIVSSDNEIRDKIISSTNNQTSVEHYSLKATDKIQRDIEEYLLKFDIYYERRTNHYRNQGVSSSKIISPLMLAYGYVTTIMKLPYKAVKLKSKFMMEKSQYDLVFSELTPLDYWKNIALLIFKIDGVIKRKSLGMKHTSNILKKMRCIVLYMSLSKYFKTFNYSIDDIVKLNIDSISEQLLEETFEEIIVVKDYRDMHRRYVVNKICEMLEEKYDINDFDLVVNRPDILWNNKFKYISEETIIKVKEALPEQPWKKNMHVGVAQNLNMKPTEISHIINILISRREVYDQKNGKLYDLDGNLVVKK